MLDVQTKTLSPLLKILSEEKGGNYNNESKETSCNASSPLTTCIATVKKPTRDKKTVSLSVELLAIHSSNIHQPGMFYHEQLCEGEGFG